MTMVTSYVPDGNALRMQTCALHKIPRDLMVGCRRPRTPITRLAVATAIRQDMKRNMARSLQAEMNGGNGPMTFTDGIVKDIFNDTGNT